MIKRIETDTYRIFFDTVRGTEVLMGINGHDDPWKLERPSLMDVGIMAHCPNKCAICYQGDDQQPNMSLADYKQLIYKMKDVVNQVALGGRGNPDEHENFYEILAYTRQCNVVPNYTTAGNTMTPEKAEISKMCGAVAVSYYKMPYTYSALKMLMDAGVKTNIHWVLTESNIDEIISTLNGNNQSFNENIDVERLNAIVFLLFKPCGRGSNLPELTPTNETIGRFIHAVRSFKGTYKIGMDSCLIGRIDQCVGLNETERTCTDSCEGGRASCYITPDMKLLPCSFGKTIESGIDLKMVDFSEAWDSELFDRFRQKLRERPNECPWLRWN